MLEKVERFLCFCVSEEHFFCEQLPSFYLPFMHFVFRSRNKHLIWRHVTAAPPHLARKYQLYVSCCWVYLNKNNNVSVPLLFFLHFFGLIMIHIWQNFYPTANQNIYFCEFFYWPCMKDGLHESSPRVKSKYDGWLQQRSLVPPPQGSNCKYMSKLCKYFPKMVYCHLR